MIDLLLNESFASTDLLQEIYKSDFSGDIVEIKSINELLWYVTDKMTHDPAPDHRFEYNGSTIDTHSKLLLALTNEGFFIAVAIMTQLFKIRRSQAILGYDRINYNDFVNYSVSKKCSYLNIHWYEKDGDLIKLLDHYQKTILIVESLKNR